MATIEKSVKSVQQVVVCDRCGKNVRDMFDVKLNSVRTSHPDIPVPALTWEGQLCEPCAKMIRVRIAERAKRTKRANVETA